MSLETTEKDMDMDIEDAMLLGEMEKLVKDKEHYISAWADACNENQCLRNELEELRRYHFEQNERMCGDVNKMRGALHAVVRAMLPQNVAPTMLRGFGAPWPEVASALWPETHNATVRRPPGDDLKRSTEL
jgi:hypothetical protein